MKLHRDLRVRQATAWFMLHRIREAFADVRTAFGGPVEVDETYVGGLRKNMSKTKRAGQTGRGPVGKAAVVGAKDRETNRVAARVVASVDRLTLHDFVDEHASADATLYTDDATAYRGTGREHETVRHSAAEYVRYLTDGKIHTNGVESFWSMLKRAHKGTFHRLSPKHLQRYIDEFCWRHNVRNRDTMDQMEDMVARMVGKRLMYRDVVADNGRNPVPG